MKKLLTLLALSAGLASAAPVTLTLSLLDGDKPFFYHNNLTLPNGGQLHVHEVKLYISNVALVKADGTEVPVPGLTLAKLQMGTPPQNIQIFRGDAPEGDYRGVIFDVGVPRDLNHQDATSAKAPLSVEDGMYWAWNSGYIFFGLHGTTSVNGADKDIALHIGGDNHRITVNLADLQKPGTAFKLDAKGTSIPVALNLQALLAKGVDGQPWDLSIPAYQQVHFGPVADQFAKNANSAFGLGK